ncbi:MAG: sigma-70 family RNA polymerase sigma factor [Clostridia bacterium]|nr:sigma-70 family RNA polymerase sigma factor [Clostridia bacterium]
MKRDEKLIALLKSDPNAGMGELISRYSGLVFAVVRGRLCGVCDSSEIEDCVADVFINFQKGFGTFVPGVSLKNYLAVIARNTAGMYMRNRIQTEPIDGGEFFTDIPESGDFTEDIAEKQLLESVYAEIRKMGSPDSDILIRKYYFGHSSKDIARDLHLSVSNVDTRAHRAIEKLRAKFGGKT